MGLEPNSVCSAPGLYTLRERGSPVPSRALNSPLLVVKCRGGWSCEGQALASVLLEVVQKGAIRNSRELSGPSRTIANIREDLEPPIGDIRRDREYSRTFENIANGSRTIAKIANNPEHSGTMLARLREGVELATALRTQRRLNPSQARVPLFCRFSVSVSQPAFATIQQLIRPTALRS